MYLEQCSKVRKEFLKKEPIGMAKIFLRVAEIIYGKSRAQSFLLLYSYIRTLDDFVDKGLRPLTAKHLLRSELNTLTSYLSDDNYQLDNPKDKLAWEKEKDFLERRNLLKNGVDALGKNLSLEKKREVLSLFIEGLKATYIDNLCIMYNRSLSDKTRLARDYRTMDVYMNAMSLVFFGEKFVNSEQSPISEFWRWAIRCDALNDLVDDLGAGHILFKRSDLHQIGINFKINRLLPKKLENLYYDERKKVVSEFNKQISNLWRSNVPYGAKLVLTLVVTQKIAKLSRTPYPGSTSTIRFAQNQLLASNGKLSFET